MTKKLYIIDDDKDFLDIASHILRKDYELTTSNEYNREDMIGFQPDLILLDNALGTDTSTEVISRMYDDIPGFATPVVLVSGHPHISHIATGRGIVGYIQKPSSIIEIRNKVAFFFERIGKRTA